MKKVEWNYEEFLTFLLIHASYADLDFSEKEIEYIKSRINEESYQKILDFYHEISEHQKLEILLQYKGIYYPTVSQKNEILNRLTDLFKIDGEYSKLEKNLLQFLNKLL